MMLTTGGFRICTNLSMNTKLMFSTSSISCRSHYDTLGITPKATQNDIKAAYYKLTMLYHPDKNKTEEAKQKFRNVTDAYEILGNYKSRKLYDRGMKSAPRHLDTRTPEERAKDDAQTQFYKARMKRTRVPTCDSRTPIYNFDEWARAHYGDLLNRQNLAKHHYGRVKEMRVAAENEVDRTSMMVPIILILIILIVVTFPYKMDNYDVNTISKKETPPKPS